MAFALLIIHVVSAQVIPNDPLFSSQYALNRIKAPDAWAITTGGETIQGDPIVVAVLDDGFDLTHPDINFWTNDNEIQGNGIDDDGNGYPDDYYGWNAIDGNGTIPNKNHGTRVAGIIGAIGNNNIGITGINWNIRILPVVVSASDPSSVIAGYEYIKAVRQSYNSSGGSSGAFIVATCLSQSLVNAIPSDYPAWCEIYNTLGSEGIMNVNGPKNWHREIGVSSGFPPTPFNDMPALCDSQYLLVVTNTDSNDDLVSQGGATGSPWSHTYVDLAAPGHLVMATETGGTYGDDASGTSFAAPAVAGAIALMFSAACDDFIAEYKINPATAIIYLRHVLLNSTDPVGGLVLLIGHGRLNIHRALTAMSVEMYEYKTLSGTVVNSQIHEAIVAIEIENYLHDSSQGIVCKAGKYIDINPTTIVMPSEAGFFDAIIDPVSFDCAIPLQPIHVSLVTPEFAYCNAWVICNAAAYGGLPPYTYRWETRLTSSGNWNIHPQTSYLLAMNGYYNDNFYVRVKVTDNLGSESWSETKLVVCIDGMMEEGETGDQIPSNASAADKRVIIDENHDSDNYFQVVPNPVNNDISHIILRARDKYAKEFSVHDNAGKLVMKFHARLKPGDVLGEYYVGAGGFRRLNVGSYYWVALLDDGSIRSTKFIVVP